MGSDRLSPPDVYQKIIDEVEALEQRLSQPDLIARPQDYTVVVQEYARIKPRADRAREILSAHRKEQELLSLLQETPADEEWRRMIEEELDAWRRRRREAEERFWSNATEDGQDEADRDFLIEIRAGTGGQEAALFAADLLKMYTKYIEKSGWRWEWMGGSSSEAGGVKEATIGVKGKGAYAALRYESGVHRVQRVPVTESSGRIHTSAATVAVLPEPEEVDLTIDSRDLKIDVFRSSGPGGQSVNTTDSAVRITHLPTGMVVVCQDERSQIKNKEKALRVLRARLMERLRREQTHKQANERRRQVGTGDRSEKIRTYNFPDRRVTDHRVGVTVHRLEDILAGDLEHILNPLRQAMGAEQTESESL